MSLRDSKGTPEPVKRLLDALTRLPGIGNRSAERIAFFLIKDDESSALSLAQSIDDVKKKVVCCDICKNIADDSPCAICNDSQRDAAQILVIEQPRDLIRLEATGMYQGIYHVLIGRIDPLAGVEISDLTIKALIDRIQSPELNARGVVVEEVILGLNPTLEGDSTALYLSDQLSELGVTVTRLARGLPSGSQIEYANTQVLSDAIAGRRDI